MGRRRCWGVDMEEWLCDLGVGRRLTAMRTFLFGRD